MTTHSLPSQTFGARPVGFAAALRRWLFAGRSARPTPTPVVDRALEANRVRAYADSVRSHDPRFAADLMAAADRHELSSH